MNCDRFATAVFILTSSGVTEPYPELTAWMNEAVFRRNAQMLLDASDPTFSKPLWDRCGVPFCLRIPGGMHQAGIVDENHDRMSDWRRDKSNQVASFCQVISN
jgi:hypothetical protein